jgi:hypothetical protein
MAVMSNPIAGPETSAAIRDGGIWPGACRGGWYGVEGGGGGGGTLDIENLPFLSLLGFWAEPRLLSIVSASEQVFNRGAALGLSRSETWCYHARAPGLVR